MSKTFTSLNSDQKQATKKLMERILTSDEVLSGLIAAGGRGKSYMLAVLLNELELGKDQVCLTAPSHDTCEALSKAMDSGERWHYPKTIYSALGLKLERVNGVDEIKPDGTHHKLNGVKLLIIDEVSMVSTIVIERLDEITDKLPNMKVLVVGDPDQALVVNEGLSPIFDYLDNDNTAYLSKNMRIVTKQPEEVSREYIIDNTPKGFKKLALQAYEEGKYCSGSAPDETVKMLKECIQEAYYSELIFENYYGALGNLITLNPKRFTAAFKYYVEKDQDTRLVCWSNKEVRRYNHIARCSVHGEEVANNQEYIVGEELIAKDVIPSEDGSTIDVQKNAVGIIRGVHKVSTLDRIKFGYGLDLSGYILEVQFDKKVLIGIPDTDGMVTYRNELARLKKNAINSEKSKRGLRWKGYYDLFSAINRVRHTWASTSHGVQGKTLGKNVFVDMINLNRNQDGLERLTLANVALSRTLKNVWVSQL